MHVSTIFLCVCVEYCDSLGCLSCLLRKASAIPTGKNPEKTWIYICLYCKISSAQQGRYLQLKVHQIHPNSSQLFAWDL